MSLKVYKKKRNFKATPEPEGKIKKSSQKLVFVIQRHKASHLHYDLRLEMDGVMKSWAVPKGPSMNPQDKRLAMMVEDHPISYNKFEGIIPEGNYGAGIVEIWDQGELTDIDGSDKKTSEKNLKAGLHKGSLKFTLKGKKLKGEFALVKVKGRGENSWLLIKHRDKFSVDELYNSEELTPKNSPINKWLAARNKKPATKKQESGNTKHETRNRIVAENDSIPVIKKKGGGKYLPAQTRKLHDYIKPMLAKETDKAFSDKEWIYELKWDGYRAIAEINHSVVKLYSRNGNTFNDSYPIVVEALEDLGIQAIIDGEIVVMDENGKSNFQLLQHYGTNSDHPIEFRVFDLLSVNGENTMNLPLLDRKKLLKQLFKKKNNIIKYSDHIFEKGEDFFEVARKNDLEGIMAKKADSLYSSGARTGEWLKIKHHKTQEAVIAGFTEPGGSRKNFGALILGIYDKGKLKYIGHTGSGFNIKGLNEMSRLLKPLIRKNSPFQESVKTNMPATWVKPELVCEIKFTEWTRDGSLRHPIFLRLRDDKKASEVTMNATKPVKAPKKSAAKKTTAKKTKTKKSGNSPAEEPLKEKFLKFGKTKVKTTNLQKIFWPEEGITKGDVINYYQSISKYILPYLKDRPESLLRNPNGINAPAFFHKDAGDEAPDWVKSKTVFSESTNKDIEYILCNNAATLAYLNNLGCIEINPWHSTTKKLNNPDYLIIDIDPSKKNTFEQVIETANVVHDVFKKAGTESYCKTSGATGLHVYVPSQKKYTYDQLKDFAHLVCILVQEQLPDFTSLERNLKKRGDKMIYLDHLQNRRGQTISSVYSLRPKPGATVSMPLKWEEVKPGLSPHDFNINNALKRIEKIKDLFLPVLGKGIDLNKCLKNLEK
ncbi:MAG: ATP-dependent ligase LigD phosphoesterase module / ATP-dependent ligase LigD polymerase [Bacteroidetes bacterium]|jgi:bifunctional non-homologous end joining protein LigD|nr:ATP-dependent ligase LigD phosphoesterase module / ATP-dependent ligase LigD polymerase [Bacteroidota bacterium]